MKKHDEHETEAQARAKPSGEQERDNDAQRPDGSGGTEHDSTAQKAARDANKRR